MRYLNSIGPLLAAILLYSCSQLVSDCKFPLNCEKENLAYNNGNFYYPSSLETSDCVERKLLKYFIVDGIRYCEDEDFRYIEFTGGSLDILDTCGWRQATVDFGQDNQINRTVVWFLKDSIYIDNYSIQYWNKSTVRWETSVDSYKRIITSSCFKSNNCPVVFLQDTFRTISTSKVRFLIKNCNSYFRMTEFEAYFDKPGERPACLLK